jgi:hypothetical protein
MKSNSKTGGILATEKPLMIIKQDRDSVYVTADTLYSGKLTELEKYRTVPNISDTATSISDSVRGISDTVPRILNTAKPSSINTTNASDSNSNRFFEAYFNVKVFSDSLQAVGDSLFYSFRDSAFRLFKKSYCLGPGKPNNWRYYLFIY